MEGREEKYRPDMISMSMEEQAGIAVANKKLAERMIEKFKRGIEEWKDRGFFDEHDFQKIKDLRRDTEETTTRFKEIITFLDAVYSGKGKKEGEGAGGYRQMLCYDHRKKKHFDKTGQRSHHCGRIQQKCSRRDKSREKRSESSSRRREDGRS